MRDPRRDPGGAKGTQKRHGTPQEAGESRRPWRSNRTPEEARNHEWARDPGLGKGEVRA